MAGCFICPFLTCLQRIRFPYRAVLLVILGANAFLAYGAAKPYLRWTLVMVSFGAAPIVFIRDLGRRKSVRRGIGIRAVCGERCVRCGALAFARAAVSVAPNTFGSRPNGIAMRNDFLVCEYSSGAAKRQPGGLARITGQNLVRNSGNGTYSAGDQKRNENLISERSLCRLGHALHYPVWFSANDNCKSPCNANMTAYSAQKRSRAMTACCDFKMASSSSCDKP
jgi:hypothetical protein